MTIGFKNMLIHAWTIILSINRVIINWTSMDISFRGSALQRNPRKLILKKY